MATSSSTSLSAMFIFGARNFLADTLGNEKPAPKIGLLLLLLLSLNENYYSGTELKDYWNT